LLCRESRDSAKERGFTDICHLHKSAFQHVEKLSDVSSALANQVSIRGHGTSGIPRQVETC